MLSLVVFSYWMSMIFVNSVPVLGQVVATVLIPVFSVSLMNACRLVEHGGRLTPQLLFSGFQRKLRPLLILGAGYLVAACLILAAVSLVDDGALFRMFAFGRELPRDNGQVLLAAQLALAAFAPLMMAYWYAPVLVAWHDVPPGKSLFFSFVACLRNWRPFLTYSVAVLIFFALIPALGRAIILAYAPMAMGFYGIAMSFVVVLILAPTLYASFYVSYREVFVVVEENG
jgi:hypothetical protein